MIVISFSLILAVILTIILNVIQMMSPWMIILEIVLGTLSFILLFILFCIIISTFTNKKKEVVNPNKFFRLCNYLLFDFVYSLFRIKIDFKGEELVDYNKHYLLICNHQSNLDPFVIFKKLHKLNLSFIIKKELNKLFLIKNWTLSVGFYALDRENNRKAIKTILQAIKAVQERTVCVFPEGTRNKDGNLLDFRDGIFKVSQKGDVDILVCTIDKSYEIKKRYPFRSTKVSFEVSGIISKEDVKVMSTQEISEKAHKMIYDSLSKMREGN